MARLYKLKEETVIVFGVSSIIISTPKSISKAFILRPSFPIILPLVSSSLIGILLISRSAANSPAYLVTAFASILLILNSQSTSAFLYFFLKIEAIWALESSFTLSNINSFASSCVKPEAFSNTFIAAVILVS